MPGRPHSGGQSTYQRAGSYVQICSCTASCFPTRTCRQLTLRLPIADCDSARSPITESARSISELSWWVVTNPNRREGTRAWSPPRRKTTNGDAEARDGIETAGPGTEADRECVPRGEQAMARDALARNAPLYEMYGC